jgi:hypothetical protein
LANEYPVVLSKGSCRRPAGFDRINAKKGEIDEHTEVMSQATTNGQWLPATRIKQLKAIIVNRPNLPISDAQESLLEIYNRNSIAVGGYDPERVFAFKSAYLGMSLEEFKMEHHNQGADGRELPLFGGSFTVRLSISGF